MLAPLPSPSPSPSPTEGSAALAPTAVGAGALVRTLGVRASTALIVGNILGMGIFLTPAVVAQAVDSGAAYLAHWVVGGLVAVAGGLVVAELGVLFPAAGGDYVYLDRAFGRPVAVAWGWLSLGVSFAGSIAAMAVGFGETLAALPALAGWRLAFDSVSAGGLSQLLAVLAVAVAFAVNAASVPWVGRLQALLAGTLLIGFAALAAMALRQAGATVGVLDVALAPSRASAGVGVGLGGAAAAVFFTYSGWNVLSYVGGDVRSPARTIPRAVLAAVALVGVLYVVLNVAFVATLGLPALRSTPNAGVALARHVLGDNAADVFGVAVAIAIFAGINSSLMAASRVALAMSADGHLPPQIGVVHPRLFTPVRALVAVALWVMVLLATGSFEALVTLSGATMIALSALSVATLFVFRVRHQRVLLLPGFPWVPGAYLVFAASVMVIVAIDDPLGMIGGLTGFGALVWALGRQDRRNTKPSTR
jgi:basic amino acid/polyamine antiporter, APA family